ncbi:MAG: hypothetical protein WAT66_00255 [Actinomycetota bacterium]
MEEDRWAAAHYRVERESSGVVMRKRQRRKATEVAIQYGDPVPDDPNDVVRIYDRSGAIAFEQDWGTNRAGAMTQEARVIDDLLHLDVFSFRTRYGIAGDTEEPTAAKPARTRGGGTQKAAAKRSTGARKSAPRKPATKKGAAGRPKPRSE